MKRYWVLTVFGLTSLMLIVALRAQAYTLLPYKWCNTLSVTYDRIFLPSGFWEAVPWGPVQWNLAEPTDFIFEVTDGGGVNYAWALYYDGPGGVLAYMAPSETNGCFNFFDVVFDSAESWNFGINEPPPPSELDLIGVSAHEFGHAAGIGHTNATCTGGSSDPTMCPYYSYGVSHFRTLEQDDLDALNALYPDCAVQQALPSSAQTDGWFETLYQLRDEVLAGSSLGDHLISFQRAYTFEAAGVVVTNMKVQRQLLDLLHASAPAVNSLVHGDGSVALDGALITQMETYIQGVAAKGSSEMSAGLLEIWDTLDLWSYEGKPVGAIWEALKNQ